MTNTRRPTGARSLTFEEFAEATLWPPHCESEELPLPRRRVPPLITLGGAASDDFPRSYVDPNKRWKGWPIRARKRDGKSMADLLRPLSATATARHYQTSEEQERALTEWPVPSIEGRMPLQEEYCAGRISDRHFTAAGWFMRVDRDGAAFDVGIGAAEYGGTSATPIWSRNPDTLWPLEAAADVALQAHKRARVLGELGRIVAHALAGAEMRDLAPAAIPVPKKRAAEAGRIRLAAGLEICARMAEAEIRLAIVARAEIAEIELMAAEACWALASSRRMRADNDNKRQAVAA
jgi:hypothetical protein